MNGRGGSFVLRWGLCKKGSSRTKFGGCFLACIWLVGPSHGCSVNEVQPAHPAVEVTIVPEPCRVQPHAFPLTIDMTPEEETSLEYAASQGVAVVSYDCNGVRLLPACGIAGSYSFSAVLPREYLMQLTTPTELMANLPLHGSGLGNHLTEDSAINLALVEIGSRTTTVSKASRSDLEGDCNEATHLVRSISVGAFAVGTGKPGRLPTMTDVFTGTSLGARTLRVEGELEACAFSQPDSRAAPPLCAVPVRIELVEIAVDPIRPEDRAKESSGPRTPENPCPVGTVLSSGKCTDLTEERHLCSPGNRTECQEQCKKGDAASCYHLAWFHLHLGKPKDSALGRVLLEKSCYGGVSAGCYHLAMEYLAPPVPEKVSRSTQFEAIQLLERACELGDPWVCWEMFQRYMVEGSSPGFSKDIPRAFALLRRSCSLGLAEGCATLAHELILGKTIKKNLASAVRLLQSACEAGRKEDCATAGDVYVSAPRPLGNVPTGVKFYEKACSLGILEACATGGMLLLSGKGIPKDMEKARTLFRQGCPERTPEWAACNTLGKMLEKGQGGPRDYAAAAEVYQRSCSQGDCLRAGRIWEKGEGGISADPERALAAYRHGCSRARDDKACKAYGKLLEKSDRSQALSFYLEQCLRESSRATMCLAAKRLERSTQ